MIVVGIDPSIKKGQAYSIWNTNNKLLTDFGKINDVESFDNLILRSGAGLVLFEDQFLFNNYKTSKELTLEIGKMIGICDLRNINYTIVNVATWQAKLKLYNKEDLKNLTSYKKKKKKAEITLNKALYIIESYGYGYDPETKIDDDIGSAILIPYAIMNTL